MTNDITGGLVSIKDGIKKPEDYTPSREVRVKLKFDVGEGEDGQAKLDRTSELANAKVQELLGLKAVTIKKPPTPRAKPAEETKPTVAATQPTPLEQAIEEAKPAVEIKEITDAALMSEVGKHNARTKKPDEIKKLIKEYAPRVVEVPQDKRQELIDKLAKLEPKGE